MILIFVIIPAIVSHLGEIACFVAVGSGPSEICESASRCAHGPNTERVHCCCFIFQWYANDFPSWRLGRTWEHGSLSIKTLRSEATHNRLEIRTLDQTVRGDQDIASGWASFLLTTHKKKARPTAFQPSRVKWVKIRIIGLISISSFSCFALSVFIVEYQNATSIKHNQIKVKIEHLIMVCSFQLQSASQNPSNLILLLQLQGSVCQKSKISWPLRAMTTPKRFWHFMVSKSSSTRKPWCRGKGWKQPGDIPRHLVPHFGIAK